MSVNVFVKTVPGVAIGFAGEKFVCLLADGFWTGCRAYCF